MTATTDAGRVTVPRRFSPGIRSRVVLGYVVLLAAALGISIVVMREVLHTRLDREIDRALAQEVEELRLVASGTNPATGEPFGRDAAAIFDAFFAQSVPTDNEAFYALVEGAPYLYSFDAPPSLLDDPGVRERLADVSRPTRFDADTAAGAARLVAVPLRSGDDVVGTFVVAFFPGNDRDDIAQAVRVVALAGLVVLVVSATVAWSLAGRVLRPVSELTVTARRITDSDLSARIPVDGADELAELGTTFNAMLDRLETGFRAQRQFLDDVAHELRTPITIARGHLEVAGADPGEQARAMEVVADELDRMGRYVGDLLVLAKADHPDFIRPAPVDVGELADSLVRRASTLADRQWVLDAAPAPGRTAVVVDGDRVSQAVLNLMTNAAQHTVDGDEIGLSVAVDGDRVTFAVRDTGPGVDPEIAGRLFQRHTRGASSRTGRPDGMGIGLSIVDAIATAHGGGVHVDPTAGGGATFRLWVPVEPPDQEHEP